MTPAGAVATTTLGGFLAIFGDRIILYCLQTYYPQTWVRDMTKDLNKRIEELKVKYPEAGKKLEASVIEDLKWAADYMEKN